MLLVGLVAPVAGMIGAVDGDSSGLVRSLHWLHPWGSSLVFLVGGFQFHPGGPLLTKNGWEDTNCIFQKLESLFFL